MNKIVIKSIKELLNQKTLFLRALAIALLPNVIFWLGAYYFGIARPLINIDYFYAITLLVLPYRITKIIGYLLFMLMIMLDVMTIAMQVFPFFDIKTALGLAPVLVNAPLTYQVVAIVTLVLVLLLPWLLLTVAHRFLDKRLSGVAMLLLSLVATAVFNQLDNYKYKTYEDVLIDKDDYIIHSQYQRYKYWSNDRSLFLTSKKPTLEKLSSPNAAMQLGRYGKSDKVLFIVAESWGVPKDADVHKDVLEQILSLDRLQYLEQGTLDFRGATIEGELRELCHVKIDGFAFEHLSRGDFSDCLVQKHKNQGYHTISMHGASSAAYGRQLLYPLLDFDKRLFEDDFDGRRRCEGYAGVCDGELFSVVAQEFAKHDKLFFYWLTLTTHATYPDSNITNHRFDCDRHGIPKGNICNNLTLHAQFFDELAYLLKSPEMAGAEMIVVGDHMPPILSREPVHQFLVKDKVSWLHLKVKD